MKEYFRHFSDIEVTEYTEYFLQEFLPKFNCFQVNTSIFKLWRVTDCKDPYIEKLSSTLKSNYNFPSIECFVIFQHYFDQPIHTDGTAVVRNASFNLPLKGFERTAMKFYKETSDVIPNRITNAHYYDHNTLSYVTEYEGSNKWVLMNTSVPHQVVGVNPNNPRITLCVRFEGNPTLDDLIKN